MNTAFLVIASGILAFTVPIFSPTSVISSEIIARIVFFLVIIFSSVYLLTKNKNNTNKTYTKKTRKVYYRLRCKLFAISILMLIMLVYQTIIQLLGFGFGTIFTIDLAVIFPVLIILTYIYIEQVDKRLINPDDGYYNLGRVILKKKKWLWSEQKIFTLSWMIKILFIPFMYSGTISTLTQLVEITPKLSIEQILHWLFLAGLTVDLIFGSIGYLLASPIFRNQIKSVDDTWDGWLVCLICYPPFISLILAAKAQTDDIIWSNWLTPSDFSYWIVALVIVITWIGYWASTVSFGSKFSNLSWRGLVSHGPYALSKHPAYICKNIYWWVYTVPFIGNSSLDILRNTLALTFVSGIYYLRAKTEERHLLKFPEYAEYYSHIEKHGLLARIRSLLSFKAKQNLN
ncbi:isoprenylcysteine carboxyl methyltransferase (ICMT) family protein [Azomonas agilis]|uniref:Isoprenylcysteine carboxyl methyltransferase (ICMT) family protein n=1 Tax=Azomonas agilis TaxID=116849 RepID=A0A562J0I5_9GAMM|nr:isoprenylcysteine carboxylmethyltransferase family protein [Azomonas agilis]TWH76334.1 isoprenylcysteine carboxyl methyltransferase (ICMT) family protein [Azomonas agilis]